MSAILCPVDFSAVSLNAARFSAFLAKRSGAELIFLHAYDGPDADVRTKIVNGIEQLGFHTEPLLGDNFRFIGSKGDLVGSVELAAQNEDIGLVVMGSNGVSSLVEMKKGSNTAAVASGIKSTLLMLPESYKGIDFKKIVFGFDFEQTVPVDAGSLMLLANLNDAELHLVHVSKADHPISEEVFDNYEKKIREMVGKNRKLMISRVVNPSVEDGLMQYFVDNGADLMVTHKDIFQVSDNSKTDVFLRMAQFPVMVLRK